MPSHTYRYITHIIAGLIIGACLGWSAAPGASSSAEHIRLFAGEILFDSARGHHFDALQRYTTGFSQHVHTNDTLPELYPELPTVQAKARLQLAYGIIDFAISIIDADTSNKQQLSARDRTAYLLAQHYYDTLQPVEAIAILDNIDDRTEGSISQFSHQSRLLRAYAYIQAGKFKDAAIILHDLQDSEPDSNAILYIKYNMGIVLLKSGYDQAGIEALASLGQIKATSDEHQTLKDRANLLVGQFFLDAGFPDRAKKHYLLVGKDTLSTNQALLGAGWASFAQGKPDRAIVPWTLLHEAEVVEESVVEARLALPYAYAKLGAHGRAANLYGDAVELFENELAELEIFMAGINEGELAKAVLNDFSTQDEDWFASIIRMADSAEKQNLILLHSSDEFRKVTDTLHDLAFLKRRASKLQTSISAFHDLIDRKTAAYADYDAVATEKLSSIREKIFSMAPPSGSAAVTTGDIDGLVSDIDALKQSYANHVSLRTTVGEQVDSFPGFRRILSACSTSLSNIATSIDDTIELAIDRQKAVSVTILEQKKRTLKNYHDNALFALAESYDFATRKKQ